MFLPSLFSQLNNLVDFNAEMPDVSPLKNLSKLYINFGPLPLPTAPPPPRVLAKLEMRNYDNKFWEKIPPSLQYL